MAILIFFYFWQSSGGVDFRTKLDLQRGAVVATELKNNSFKLAKWTAGALLAGSDQIKFGFVYWVLLWLYTMVDPKKGSLLVRHCNMIYLSWWKQDEYTATTNFLMKNFTLSIKKWPSNFKILRHPNK